jgi:hypothetical protein
MTVPTISLQGHAHIEKSLADFVGLIGESLRRMIASFLLFTAIVPTDLKRNRCEPGQHDRLRRRSDFAFRLQESQD